MSETANAKTSPLRLLPSVDQLLRTEAAAGLRKLVGLTRLKVIARTVTDEMRAEILASDVSNGDTRETFLREAEQRLKEVGALETKAGIRRVINATGVILHTNLGRA